MIANAKPAGAANVRASDTDFQRGFGIAGAAALVGMPALGWIILAIAAIPAAFVIRRLYPTPVAGAGAYLAAMGGLAAVAALPILASPASFGGAYALGFGLAAAYLALLLNIIRKRTLYLRPLAGHSGEAPIGA